MNSIAQRYPLVSYYLLTLILSVVIFAIHPFHDRHLRDPHLGFQQHPRQRFDRRHLAWRQ